MFPRASSAPSHLILLGNPGSGKSAILNTLIGRPVFDLTPLTTSLSPRQATYLHQGRHYTLFDTPGLTSPPTAHNAWTALTSLLHTTVNPTLVFVLSLDDLCLRPQDLQALNHILSAADQAGKSLNESLCIIVNQCSHDDLVEMSTAQARRAFCANLPVQPARMSVVAKGDCNITARGCMSVMQLVTDAPIAGRKMYSDSDDDEFQKESSRIHDNSTDNRNGTMKNSKVWKKQGNNGKIRKGYCAPFAPSGRGGMIWKEIE